MPKKTKKNTTISKHKPLFVLLALLIVAAVGSWYMLNEENQKSSPKAENRQSQTQLPAPANKTFQSSTLGLQFTYPRQWIVSQGFDDKSGLDEKTNLRIKHPSGLVIRVEPSYMGRKEGTTCTKNIYDKPHNTLSCTTIEVFSKQKTGLSSIQGEVYLIKALHTGPRPAGSSTPPKPHQLLFLSSDPKLTGSDSPLVGDWPEVGTVLTNSGYITFYLEGVDNTKSNFFSTLEIIEASQILASMKDYKTSP